MRVVGQNGEPEVRAELRTGRSRLIASVGYFPEKYGDGLMRLAFDILARKAVAPAVFTNHQIITPDNVDHYYPNGQSDDDGGARVAAPGFSSSVLQFSFFGFSAFSLPSAPRLLYG